MCCVWLCEWINKICNENKKMLIFVTKIFQTNNKKMKKYQSKKKMIECVYDCVFKCVCTQLRKNQKN